MSCYQNTPCNPCADCPPAPVSYTLPNCPGGEPCEEILSVDCILYKGPNLPALKVENNDRLIEVLTKLHRAVNSVIDPAISVISYTATNTTTAAGDPPFKITYLGLGPVYTSTAGATSSGSVITVGSTTGLVVGMSVSVVSGTGAFNSNTVVTVINNATSFTVSQAPSTALSGGQTIVRAIGSEHTIYNVSVLKNVPQTFQAFTGSVVQVSGTGTVV